MTPFLALAISLTAHSLAAQATSVAPPTTSPTPVAIATEAQQDVKLPDCHQMRLGRDCQVEINLSVKRGGRTIRVNNGTEVTLVFTNKPLLSKVTYEPDRKESPPPDAAGAIFGLATGGGLSVINLAASTFRATRSDINLAEENQRAYRSKPRAESPPAILVQLDNRLGELLKHAQSVQGTIVLQPTANVTKEKCDKLTVPRGSAGLAEVLNTFLQFRSCLQSLGEEIDPNAFIDRRDRLFQLLVGADWKKLTDPKATSFQFSPNSLLTLGLPSIAGERLQLAALGGLLEQALNNSKVYESDLAAIRQRIAEIDSILRQQETVVAEIDKARGRLLEIVHILRGETVLKPTRTARITIPRDSNAELTQRVVVKDLISGTEKKQEQVRILFANESWVSVSAGVLMATNNRRSYDIETFQRGTSETAGVVTVDPFGRIRENPDNFQLVPFTFASFVSPRLLWRVKGVVVGPEFQFGVGLNTAADEAEFAVGPSLRIGRLSLLCGFHYGRIASLDPPFAAGQLLPTSTKLPVSRAWDWNPWVFGVTYRLIK